MHTHSTLMSIATKLSLANLKISEATIGPYEHLQKLWSGNFEINKVIIGPYEHIRKVKPINIEIDEVITGSYKYFQKLSRQISISMKPPTLIT